MAWLILNMRAALCGAVCAAALASHAADVSLVSVTQVKRGEVVARVSYVGAGGLQANELSLRLDADEALPAAAVAAAPAAAAPAALLLCLDRSGSMGAPAMTAMQSALRESLAARGGAAQLPFSVAIIAFATRTSPLLSLTNDPSRIAAAVAKLGVERDGRTKLYDAVAGGLAELRATDATSKRLIVVSDGDDEGSSISEADLIKRAKTTSIPVDAVGFGALAASRSGSLATLAGATGGDFQVASSGAELTAALGRMIRQAVPAPQYDVTFHYTAVVDGRMSEAPKLVYKPQAGTAVELPMGASLAAAVGRATASAPAGLPTNVPAGASAGGGTENTGSNSLIDLAAIRRFAAALPALAWVGAGVLLLLLLAMLIWRRSQAGRTPISAAPPPPETVWSPPLASTVIRSTTAPPTVAPAGNDVAAPVDRRTLVLFRWPTPGEGRVVAILLVTSGATKGRRIEITTARVRIGSTADNDLVLEGDDFVSSHHAILRAETNGLYLVDLGSTNGTDLNGTRFKDSTRSLSPGDRFTLGRTTLEVMTADSPHGRHPAFEPRVR